MSTLGALFSCPLFPDITGVSSIIKAGDFNHYATVSRLNRKKIIRAIQNQATIQRFEEVIFLAFGGI